MLPVFNGLILDVAVIVILLMIIAIGSFKGILHTAINFLLLSLSVFLSFMSFTNLLKRPIIQLISSIIELGVITPEHKLGAYMLYPLIASLILTILFYVIFRLIKCLIVRLIEKKKKSKLPDVYSRISGAIFSLIFNGIFALACLSVFATNLVGGTKTIESSYVAKHIDKLDNILLKTIKDENLHDELIVKVINSNLTMKVSEADLKTFKTITGAINEDKIIPTDLNSVQTNIDNLVALLTYMEKNGINSKGVEIDGYELCVEQTREIATKSINAFASLKTSKDLILANNTLALQNLLKKFNLEESAKTLENIFIIN